MHASHANCSLQCVKDRDSVNLCTVCVLTHLDVGCVEVSEGGQSSRQAVGTVTDPQGLENAGGHARPLTKSLRGKEHVTSPTPSTR